MLLGVDPDFAESESYIILEFFKRKMPQNYKNKTAKIPPMVCGNE